MYDAPDEPTSAVLALTLNPLESISILLLPALSASLKFADKFSFSPLYPSLFISKIFQLPVPLVILIITKAGLNPV